MASRLTALPKESGVAKNLDDADDAYAVRRAELDTQFHALPPLERPNIGVASKARVLSSRYRLRYWRDAFANGTRAGAVTDAERIFNVILRRVQSPVQRWARLSPARRDRA